MIWSWRHESRRHDLVCGIASSAGLLCPGYEQGRRRAVKRRAKPICFTPKLGAPSGQPVRFVTPKDCLKNWIHSIILPSKSSAFYLTFPQLLSFR